MARLLALVVFLGVFTLLFNVMHIAEDALAIAPISAINPGNLGGNQFQNNPTGTNQQQGPHTEGTKDKVGKRVYADPAKFQHECNQLHKDSRACSQTYGGAPGPGGLKVLATECKSLLKSLADHAWVPALSPKHTNKVWGCFAEGDKEIDFVDGAASPRGSYKCWTWLTGNDETGDKTGKLGDRRKAIEVTNPQKKDKCDWWMEFAIGSSNSVAAAAANPSSTGQTHLPFAIADNICYKVDMAGTQPNPYRDAAQNINANGGGAKGTPKQQGGFYKRVVENNSEAKKYQQRGSPAGGVLAWQRKTNEGRQGDAGSNMGDENIRLGNLRSTDAEMIQVAKKLKIIDGSQKQIAQLTSTRQDQVGETITAQGGVAAVTPAFSTYDPYDYPPGEELKMAKALEYMTEDEVRAARDMGSKMVPKAFASIGGGSGGVKSLMDAFQKVNPELASTLFKKQGNQFFQGVANGMGINSKEFGFDFQNFGMGLDGILDKLFGQLSEFAKNIVQQFMGGGKMKEQPPKAQQAMWDSMQNLKVSDLSNNIKAAVPPNMQHLTIAQLPENIRQSIKSIIDNEPVSSRSPAAQNAMSSALNGLDIKSLLPNSMGGSGGSGAGADMLGQIMEKLTGPLSGMINDKFKMNKFRDVKNNPYAQMFSSNLDPRKLFATVMHDRDYTHLTVGAAGPAAMNAKNFMTYPGYGRGNGDTAFSGRGSKGYKSAYAAAVTEPEVKKQLAAAAAGASGDTIMTRIMDNRYDQLNALMLARIHYNRWCRGDGNPIGCCIKCTCPPKPCDYGVACFTNACWIATLPETWRGKYITTKLHQEQLKQMLGKTGTVQANYRRKKNNRYVQEASYNPNGTGSKKNAKLVLVDGKISNAWDDAPAYTGKLTDIPDFAPVPLLDMDGVTHVAANTPEWVRTSLGSARKVTPFMQDWVKQKLQEQYESGQRASPDAYINMNDFKAEGIVGITGWTPPCATRWDHGADLGFYWKDKDDKDDYYAWSGPVPWKFPRTPYCYHPELMNPFGPRKPMCGNAMRAGADVNCNLDNGDNNPNNNLHFAFLDLAHVANAPVPMLNKLFQADIMKLAQYGLGAGNGATAYGNFNNNFPPIAAVKDNTKSVLQSGAFAKYDKDDHARVVITATPPWPEVGFGTEGGGTLISSSEDYIPRMASIPTDPSLATPAIRLADDVLASTGGGKGTPGTGICFGGMGGETECNKNGTGEMQNVSAEMMAYQMRGQRLFGQNCITRYERTGMANREGIIAAILGVTFPTDPLEKPLGGEAASLEQWRKNNNLPQSKLLHYTSANGGASSRNETWRYPLVGLMHEADAAEAFGKGAGSPWKKEIKGMDDVVKLGENAARVVCLLPKGGAGKTGKGRLPNACVVHDVSGKGDSAVLRCGATCRGPNPDASGTNDGCGIYETFYMVKKEKSIPKPILKGYKSIKNRKVDPKDCSDSYIGWCEYTGWDDVVCYDPKDKENHPRGEGS
ncbi:MAG: hypothetical protein MRY32_02040 [Rickettsiales bacterium]|nr:hypothetical protein [Rickettsiales bacterium]